MRLTKPQQQALQAKWIYSNQNKTYLQFRRAVQEVFMGREPFAYSGAVCG